MNRVPKLIIFRIFQCKGIHVELMLLKWYFGVFSREPDL